MRRGGERSWWLVAGLVLAVMVVKATPALANGNYSHVWVATDTLAHLPAGDLKDLLDRPGLANIVRNGAMYPDGGYAVGDGYGEISHWEPFHLVYLDWIKATFAPPWSDEAAEHIAFLLGMTTHGLTDQLYDGMYLQRYEYYDENGNDASPFGVDGTTDTCFAATQGQMAKPTSWVPADVLAPLYDQLGHHVEAQTLKQGHNLVPFAIVHANVEAADPAKVAEYMAIYPWACGHQDDPKAPGSPPTCGAAIAAYWQVIWARLHGPVGFDQPLLATWFTGGTPWDHPTDAANPDSWVSFAMARGLDPSTVTPDNVVVTRDGGDVHPVAVNVYYGTSSHLVNVKPLVDWADDASYTVTISPPLASWDGVPLTTTYTFSFATLADPNPPEPEPEEVEVVEEIAEPVEVLEAVETVETIDAVEAIDAPDVLDTAAQSDAPDASTTDLAVPDPGAPDPAAPDASAPDRTAPDAAETDTATGNGDGGGACAVRPLGSGSAPLLLGLLLATVLLARRRRAA